MTTGSGFLKFKVK